MRYYQLSEELCVQIYLCTYYILIYHSAYNFHWNWYCYKTHHLVQKYDFSKWGEDYLWDRTYGSRCMGALASNVLQLLSFFRKPQIANHFPGTSSSSYSGKRHFSEVLIWTLYLFSSGGGLSRYMRWTGVDGCPLHSLLFYGRYPKKI